jgi:hypothetical protein
MALETTFRQLHGQLKRLKEMLDPLRCLLPEDPLNLEVALVQHLRESIETVSGWLDECVAESQAAQAAVESSTDLSRTRKALNRCQASFDQADGAFGAELLSYDKLREIARLGARRRGVWLIWSDNVKRDLEACRYELDVTRRAMTACWQELAEHAGRTNISVQTTSVGQRITASRTDVGELEVEGVT